MLLEEGSIFMSQRLATATKQNQGVSNGWQ